MYRGDLLSDISRKFSFAEDVMFSSIKHHYSGGSRGARSGGSLEPPPCPHLVLNIL